MVRLAFNLELLSGSLINAFYFGLEIDPRESQATSHVHKPTIFGVQPPDNVALEDLCEPQRPCPECESKDVKCSPGGVSLIDLISRWEVRPYGDTKYSMVNLTRATGTFLIYFRNSLPEVGL